MNEGPYNWACVHCGHIVFWDPIQRRITYTCTCCTRQFKMPTPHTDWIVGDEAIAPSTNKRTEVPQVFYSAFEGQEEWQI